MRIDIIPLVFFTDNCYEELIMGDDYINELTYDEKISFLKIFCMLVRVDGYIETEEVDFLNMVAQKYGIDSSVVIGIINESENLVLADEVRKISNRTHIMQLIKELCFFANIDENLDEKEVDFIIQIAQLSNIEGEKVVQINRWVLDSLALNKVGKTILGQ